MNKGKQGKEGKMGLAKCAAVSAVMGLVLTLLLLFAVAALTVSGTIPADMSDEYIICAVIIGTAVAGARCAKKMGTGVITAGLTASGLYLVVIIIGTIFTAKSAEDGVLTLKIVLAALAGGAFGGALRLYRRTKKSKIRKRI